MDDLISRQAAITNYQRVCREIACNDCPFLIHVTDTLTDCRLERFLHNLPSAQQGRLTDDDFEAIRIHLNAFREDLCNQGRWKEAEDYERLIDRFMSFASAQPERKKGRWIKHEVKLFDGCHTGRYFEECSECGKLTPEWRIVTEYHYWYFCPKCGACNARETT